MTITKNPVQEMSNKLRDKVAETKIDKGAVRATTDYSIFKTHPMNREVNEEGNYLEHLTKAIDKHNLLSIRPILVNESMEVIDGQHRLAAARILKVPIYYQVSEKLDEKDILMLNVNQKSWMLADYLKFYCTQGNPNYIKFKDFIEKEEFKIVEGLMALYDGQKKGASRGFQRGDLVFPKGADFEPVVQKIEKYRKVVGLIKKKSLDIPVFLKSSNFRTALLRFVDIKAVDVDYFLTRLELKLEALRMVTSTGAYLAQFEAIYNFGTKVNKIDLNKELDSEIKREIVQETMLFGEGH